MRVAAFNEAVECCACVCDTGLQGLAECAGGALGLGREICFCELCVLLALMKYI